MDCVNLSRCEYGQLFHDRPTRYRYRSFEISLRPLQEITSYLTPEVISYFQARAKEERSQSRQDDVNGEIEDSDQTIRGDVMADNTREFDSSSQSRQAEVNGETENGDQSNKSDIGTESEEVDDEPRGKDENWLTVLEPALRAYLLRSSSWWRQLALEQKSRLIKANIYEVLRVCAKIDLPMAPPVCITTKLASLREEREAWLSRREALRPATESSVKADRSFRKYVQSH